MRLLTALILIYLPVAIYSSCSETNGHQWTCETVYNETTIKNLALKYAVHPMRLADHNFMTPDSVVP